MGDLGSRLGQGGYLIRLGVSAALFVVAMLVFPFVATPFLSADGCLPDAAVPGCAPNLMPLLSRVYFPLAALLIVASFAVPLMGRLRDLGISAWFSLPVFGLIAMEHHILEMVISLWSRSAFGDIIGFGRPDFLLEALALLLVLGLIPGRDGRLDLRRIGWPGWLVVALAVPIVVMASVGIISSLGELRLPLSALLVPTHPIMIAGRTAMVLLPFAVGYALWPRYGEIYRPEPQDGDALPIRRLALLAGVLTFIVLLVATPASLHPLSIADNFVRMVLPTFALYSAVLLAIYLWVWRGSGTAVALTIVLFAVFGGWIYQRYAYVEGAAADIRQSAVLTTGIPMGRPRVVLLETRALTKNFRQALLDRGDITDVVERQDDGSLLAYRRPRAGSDKPTQMVLAQLPTHYLHLKAATLSSHYDGTSHHGTGPYELRLVAGADSRRAAVWISHMRALPVILPVLTDSGWAAVYEARAEPDETIGAFLLSALGPAP